MNIANHIPEIVSLSILIVTYLMVVSERINRTIAAVLGGVMMIVIGLGMGFFDQAEALQAIDLKTIGLLFGMMILVGIMGESGIFEYLAYKTAQNSKGSYYRLLALFMLITALCSAFLDNVTTILLMIPITFTIADKLNIDPKPFLFAEVMASNIGGTATLIGDPPNIMIGSAANITFLQFMIYLGPMVVIVLLTIMLYFELIYKDKLERDMKNFDEIKDVDPRSMIKDPLLAKKSIFVFTLVIILFLLHHTLHLEPWTVAITGATLLMALTFSDPEEAVSHVEWPTLLFFVGFFIVIGGVEASGGIELIANALVYLGGSDPLRTALIVMWTAALLSMVIDNIPITMALISAIQGISVGAGFAINPLWWALSLGACLGGNGTMVGAAANVVMVGISDKKGKPIDFKEFTKIGLPVAFISLILSSIMLYAFIFLGI